MIRRLLLLASLLAAFVPAPARADVAPLLVIYSFSVEGNVQPTVGQRFADAIADEIGHQSGLVVQRGAAGIASAQARADARTHNADYLLIGTVAPLGPVPGKYSVLIDLVRAGNGLLAWSSSVQAGAASDLVGAGTQIRQIILDQTGRASFGPSTPAPLPPPAPAGGFAVAGAAPTPAPLPPSTFAVMSLGGSALPSDRSLAVQALLEAIRKRASAVADALPGDDVQRSGAQACMDTDAATIVGGMLDTEHVDSPDTVSARVSLQVYDCRTQTMLATSLVQQRSAPVSSDAIRTAAQAAIAAYFAAVAGPSPAPKR